MERKSISPIRVPVEKPSEKFALDYERDYASFANEFNDGRLVKMEVDYTTQVEAAVENAEKLSEEGKVKEAVESLYSLEKQTRLGCDMKSNNNCARAIVRLAFEGKQYALLNEVIVMLCKKRSLIKYTIKNMIRDCCNMVDKIADEPRRNKLIETLRQVTLGKIYVEVERARLTKWIVQKLEAEGKEDEARKLIMELQVETYSSMDITERVIFLLYQMRLTVAQKDFLRASFIARKISTKYFESDKEEVQNLKLEFYKYMVQIGLHNEEYLEVCKHYRAILNTKQIADDSAKTAEALKCIVLYVLLASHSNEQFDLMHRINTTRELELIPNYKALLGLFINEELISWKGTILQHYGDVLRANTDVFDSENGEKKLERLRERVGEHNVRMIAKYYTEINFQRMAELLEHKIDEMEKFVCNMIVTGVIPTVKIHRPNQTIFFSPQKASTETLDAWVYNVHKLTDTLNKVSHLILKEEMVHRHIQD